MKLIHATLLLTVLAVFANGQNEISTLDGSEFVEKVAAYRRQLSMERVKSVIEEICPGQFEDFRAALTESVVCHSKLNGSLDTVCTMLNEDVTKCLSPTFKFFYGCIPEDERFSVKLMEALARNAVNFFCTSDVEHLMELINPCTKTFSTRNRCVKDFLTKVESYKKNKLPPTKERVCNLIDLYSDCVMSFVKTNCQNRITRESFANLVKVFKKIC